MNKKPYDLEMPMQFCIKCDICGKLIHFDEVHTDGHNVLFPGKPYQFLCNDCFDTEIRKIAQEKKKNAELR